MNKNGKLIFAMISTLLMTLLGCSSNPAEERPAWVKEPARIVDNGYIVYVAQSEGLTKEKAQFRAEGLALEDLANECSFLPKGTRIEDRYSEDLENHQHFVAVKVGLEFKDCDAAQKTEDPEKVREKASIAFTEQLKRFQDLEENGTTVAEDEGSAVTPPTESSAVPVAENGMSDQTHFYLVRQYVLYQKQIVILSPPGSYAPGSPALVSYNNSMAAATPVIIHYNEVHPEFAKATQPPPLAAIHPLMPRPPALAPPPRPASAFRPPMGRPPMQPGGRNWNRRNGRPSAPPPPKYRRKPPP